MHTTEPATFEQTTALDIDRPTLIEGLPGHGLVASIAVDQISDQLELEPFGTLYDETFPKVVTFEDGMARDPVRLFGAREPSILTLQSDLAIPYPAFSPLAQGLFDAVGEFEQAIFLAGAPAGNESEGGSVKGVATTPEMREKLVDAGIDLAENPGVVGGVTGALAQACQHEAIPAAVLIVKSHPYLPDPGAAQQLIENALEPLVDFDIETAELEKQAAEIQERMQQIAQQYEQLVEGEKERPESGMPGMYQ